MVLNQCCTSVHHQCTDLNQSLSRTCFGLKLLYKFLYLLSLGTQEVFIRVEGPKTLEHLPNSLRKPLHFDATTRSLSWRVKSLGRLRRINSRTGVDECNRDVTATIDRTSIYGLLLTSSTSTKTSR